MLSEVLGNTEGNTSGNTDQNTSGNTDQNTPKSKNNFQKEFAAEIKRPKVVFLKLYINIT